MLPLVSLGGFSPVEKRWNGGLKKISAILVFRLRPEAALSVESSVVDAVA